MDEAYESLKKKFGEHIKMLRLSKGLSTIEMSRRCLMDSGNYVGIEQGQTNPTLKTMHKLCKALDINIQDLFGEFDY